MMESDSAMYACSLRMNAEQAPATPRKTTLLLHRSFSPAGIPSTTAAVTTSNKAVANASGITEQV